MESNDNNSNSSSGSRSFVVVAVVVVTFVIAATAGAAVAAAAAAAAVVVVVVVEPGRYSEKRCFEFGFLEGRFAIRVEKEEEEEEEEEVSTVEMFASDGVGDDGSDGVVVFVRLVVPSPPEPVEAS
ncbi:hypothetical protein HZH66_004887 [Vespula vulgaris]|uniref:Uncharacterized protein n=1 Tax=Vespula vulgaris TaxID=7454 RepID=A0A834NB97_VESVU|nr:hypothetical protein HZH66_004887 [Vespula vulgaris]